MRLASKVVVQMISGVFHIQKTCGKRSNLCCHGCALSQKGTGIMGIVFEEELTDGWAVLWLMLDK